MYFVGVGMVVGAERKEKWEKKDWWRWREKDEELQREDEGECEGGGAAYYRFL